MNFKHCLIWAHQQISTLFSLCKRELRPSSPHLLFFILVSPRPAILFSTPPLPSILAPTLPSILAPLLSFRPK
jgi:hypothetical protein